MSQLFYNLISKSMVIYVFLFSLKFLFIYCEEERSLSFVIDESGSMHREFQYVRKAVKDITRMCHAKYNIDHYTLVSFSDYDAREPVKVKTHFTSISKLFKAVDLMRATLAGGRDCVELSLSGVKEALLQSSENNFLILFTDGGAKDRNLTDEVISIARRKGSQVVIVMAPRNYPNIYWGCKHPFIEDDVKYFDRIAEATNGRMFRLQHINNIDQVVKYVERMNCKSGSPPQILWPGTPPAPATTERKKKARKIVTMEVKEGDPMDIQYDVKGYPEPTVKWFYKSPFMRSFEPLSVEGDHFHVITTDIYYSGQFKCIASNVNGNDEKTVNVIVKAPPKNVLISADGNVEDIPYNSKLILTCEATANPRPTFIWKDVTGTSIPSAPMAVIKPFVYESKIIINNVKSNNKYSCFTFNSEGTNLKEISIKIGSPFSFKSSNGTVVNVGYEKDAFLKCNIESHLPLAYTWYNNRGEVIKDSDHFKLSTNELIINKVDESLEGKYRCKAYLKEDENHRASIDYFMQINDIEVPRIEDTETMFTTFDDSPFLRVPCNVRANPKATITWMKNGKEISKGDKYRITDTALTIFRPKETDSGNYTCKGSNKFGQAEKTFQVNIAITRLY